MNHISAPQAHDEGAPSLKRARGRPRKSEMADSSSRHALIVAAARQFREKGFDATTTRDIAHSIGMQSGSPFYHFKSKSDLLFAIIEEGMQAAQRSQDVVLAEMEDGASASEILYALALNHLCVLWLPGNDFVPVMLFEWRAITPAQRKKIQSLKDAYEEPWRAVLEALHDQGRLGTSASLARSMLFGILHGTMRWFNPNGRLGLEQLAQECVNALVARQGDGSIPSHSESGMKVSSPLQSRKTSNKPSTRTAVTSKGR